MGVNPFPSRASQQTTFQGAVQAGPAGARALRWLADPSVLSVLAAIATACALPGWLWGPLAVIGVTLRIAAWERGGGWVADLIGGGVCGVLSCSFLIMMDPLLPLLPAVVGCATWVVAGLLHRGGRRLVPASLAGPLACATAEYLRIDVVGLPAVSLGLGLAETPALALGGVMGEHGVVLLAALAGGALYVGLASVVPGFRRPDWTVLELLPAPALLLVGIVARGEPPAADRQIACLAIQPAFSIADLRRLPPDARFAVQKGLTREALANGPAPDLITWGESAWTTPLITGDPEVEERLRFGDIDRQREAVVELFVGIEGDPLLLVGATSQRPPPPGSRLGRAESAELALFDRAGALLGHATKDNYIPFVEGLPLQGRFPLADRLSRLVWSWLGITPSSIRPAGEPSGPLPPVGRLPSLGTAVCWDNLFESTFRRQIAVPRGGSAAAAFVVASNEAWFGGSVVREQMLAATRWRAAETGRAVLRATDAGPTVVIGARGELLAELPVGRRASGILSLPLATGGGLTPYAIWGRLLLPAASGLTLLLVLAALIQRVRGGRSAR